MMDFFKCKCGETFNELTRQEREDSESTEAWGQRAITTTYTTICPACHSDELSDFSPCQVCLENDPFCLGTINGALDGYDECASCLEDTDPDAYREYMLLVHNESDGEPVDSRAAR